MQLTIPQKIDGLPYSRVEMEAYLRENLLAKNHMTLRQLALKYYKLHPDYYLGCPVNVILHWLLDRMIDESNKSDTIKVAGEKFGLAPVARVSDAYKIKGFDPRGNNDVFLQDYTKILGQFISRRLAILPGDNEGIRIEDLQRYVEPTDDGFVPPPTPPGVAPDMPMGMVMAPSLMPPQPMPPPAPARKPRGRPTIAKAEKPEIREESQATLTVEMLARSLRAELSIYDDKYNHLEDRLNSLEALLVDIRARLGS